RNPKLTYVGHTGTGFNERELARLMKLLKPLEIKASPFGDRPRTNERPHWVQPRLVPQIKFTEWTADGKLRHPVYLGLRDDKKPEDIVRERKVRLHSASSIRLKTVRLKPDTTYEDNKTGVVSGFPGLSESEGSRTLIEQLRELE